MNSPLLGLTSGMSTPASSPNGAAEAEASPTSSFGDLLLQMTESGAAVSQDVDASLDPTAVASEQTEETPADLLASLVANLAGAETTDTEVDESVATNATDKDEVDVSDPETESANLAVLALTVPASTLPTVTVAETGTPNATDLPVGGKSLPTPWLLLNQQASNDQDLNGQKVDDASSALAEPAEAWTQLFEAVGKTVEFKAATEASAPLARQVSSEPLLAVSSFASALTGATPSTRAASPDAVAGIPVRSANFATLVGNEVLWQAKIGNNQAEIRLDPPELGPIDVRISRSDNETHLHFMVSHQATRDQLEQAMPRLRELFGQGGLQLGQVEVEQGRREQLAQQPRDSSPGAGKRGTDVAVNEEVLSHRTTVMGLIDDYA